jgi:hypothetical protein
MTPPVSRPPLILRATVDRWLADSGALSALPTAPQLPPDPGRRPAGVPALQRLRARVTGSRRLGGVPAGSPYVALPD